MASATAALTSGQGSLRIGDTILLLIKTREYSGYVYSEISSTPYNFLTVYNAKRSSDKELLFPNVAYATFKVLAPNKYKAKQNLRELQQRKSEEYEILNAKRAVKIEDSENKLEQQRRFGSKVLYGDFIQLQHTSSKKFIKVCSEASKTESNNLLVSLTDENFEECIFKILPRYKVRSEGDEVRFNDQLKIESIKNPGQYLHCSGTNHTLGAAKFTLLTDSFELNLSATESAFTLISHYCPSSKHPDKALRAGTCVRLFHKEDECYIVAEGSFAEYNPIVEDVHCRLRHVDSRKHSAPSTSSNTYWQIEKQEDSRSGDIISWRERCRLRHLPTRLYLAVVKENDEWKVTLKEKSGGTDLETLFSFHPLIEEGDEVLLDSYARLKHLLSRQWLHLEKKSYNRKKFDPNAKGLAGLQWDSADLYILTTSSDRGDYDSFTLQGVSEDLIDKFNYAAGVVPVLSAYINQLHDKGVIEKQAIRVRDTLRELSEWIVTGYDRETKDNQKLLRNLRILEQLSEILKYADQYGTYNTHIEICRECYNVIKKFLEGDSRKNENYIARFIEFFQTQMRKGLNAEEVLVEIVQDNLTIVSTMADTQMSHMIDEFLKTEDPRFLLFLSSLCVCGGRPIPSTQNRLLKELVLDRGKDIFLKTKAIPTGNVISVYCYDPKSPDNLMKLNSLHQNKSSARKSFHGVKQKKDFLNLFEAQLQLFARLCEGNNKAAIDTLVCVDADNTDGYISFDEALLCVQDPAIDATIRSRYIELILVMFVDVGDNRSFLDHLCYSFEFNQLVADPYSDTGGSEIEALTGVKNIHFPKLKKWILHTLNNNIELKCDTEFSQHNNLLENVLDVLAHLVRYGYYDDVADVNEAMIPLIQILDGTTDIPSLSRKESLVDMNAFKGSGRKEDVPENKDVFAVKVKALEIMELFFRFKFYVKLQKFLYDFKVVESYNKRSGLAAFINELTSNDPPQSLTELLKSSSQKGTEYSLNVFSAVNNRIKFLCDGSTKQSGFAPSSDKVPSLENVLLDLSEYECDELVTSSLNLLTQMYFFEEELFNKAQQSQLLTSSDSIRDYKEVNDNILPKLRQLLRVDTNRDNQNEIIQLLKHLQTLCLLPSSTQPNRQNQIMLDNFGLVSEIVSFVLEKGRSGTQNDSGSNSIVVGEEVFQSCFCLLRYIATNNLSAQKRIFNRIDDLLEVKVPTPALADLADLITEVFTGGPEIILKLTEYHFEKIFEIIIHCDNARVQTQFMVTLQAMAKTEELNLPVGRNQAFIIKNFCRLRESFCQDILKETADIEQIRMDILLNSSDEDPKLHLLLSVTDLLAGCAEGKNLFIESVCQNIFSMEELVKIMCCSLPPYCKRPFVRYLIWVYMNTEAGDSKQNKQNSSLIHGEIMWNYLEHLASLLENVAKVLSSASSGDIDALRQEMIPNVRRRNSLSAQSPVVHYTDRFPRLPSVSVPDVTDEKGQLAPGLLDYLADGILPLLHTYYSNFFHPYDMKEDQEEKEFTVSAMIAKSLVLLGPELAKVFCSDAHTQIYQETINTLMMHSEIKSKTDISETQSQEVLTSVQMAQPALQRLQKIESEEESNNEQILKDYEEQEKLNDLFNVYSQNYCLVYVGPNTAKHQISSSVPDEIEYSDEGEELPLGPSFQRLVKLYIDYSKLTVKPYAGRLLVQLEVSFTRTEQLGEAEQVNQNLLDIRCLQILRALIHNQIKLIDPELKDRDPIKFRKLSDDLIVPVQDAIQNFDNAISRVIPLLSHPNESISREALALMKTLLFSGNESVQEGLTIEMRESREEKLFLNLKRRLEIAGLNYKEMIDLEEQLRKRNKSTTAKALTSRQLTKKSTTLTRIEPDPPSVQYTVGKEVAIPLETLGEDNEPLIDTKPSSLKIKGVSFNSDTDSLNDSEDTEHDPLLAQLLASDIKWTSLVLEVIGFMCDGQYRTLQNYLREQPDNFKTVNVVAEVVNFLHIFTADLARANLEHVSQILQALIEMCVGNVDNQQVTFDKLVMDPINKLLQLQLEKHEECEFDECPICNRLLNTIEVKGRAVELLDVILEEISPKTVTIATGIGSSLDVESVLETMTLFYELQAHPLVRSKQMDDDCQRGMFKAYHSLVTLIEYEAISIKDTKELKNKTEHLEELSNKTESGEHQKKLEFKKFKDAYDKSNESTRTIEIHYEEEGSKPILAKVPFPYNPQDALREEVTELVRWSVNRDSMEDKQRALLDLMPSLKRDIRHQSKLKSYRILKPFLAFHTTRSRLLLFLTILLNLFVLFIYTVPTGLATSNSVFLPEFPYWFLFVFYILGSLHLILSFWIVVEYFVINWPHFRLPSFVYKWRAKIQNFFHKRGRCSNYKIPQFNCIDVGIFSVSTLYMLILLTCSILSLVYFRGYFYCFCLLFIIVDNDILKRVLRAVTKNGISLIWVAILGLIVLFIYAVISFALLHSQYDHRENNDASLYCSNLGQCMYSVLRYGLTDNLGLLIPINGDGDTFINGLYAARLIFDLSFFIIVTTIGLNIVFGIIVDTFSELREERSNTEAEQKSNCFICDLPSYLFERKAKGFNNHVKHDHNMWDYVYYSLYLDNIDTGDHNAIQKYVYELMDDNNTKFFPQQEARCLEGEEDTTGEKIEELQFLVQDILKHFREKEHAKSLIVKQQEQKKWEDEVFKTHGIRPGLHSMASSLSVSFETS